MECDVQTTEEEHQFPYENCAHNGLIFHGIPLPLEVVSRILIDVDCKSLTNCQLVCKKWHSILHENVWRKKAEIALGHRLNFSPSIPWYYYYFWATAPFEKNLLKNPPGQTSTQFWNFSAINGRQPLEVAPLPDSATFFRNTDMPSLGFVSKHYSCEASQTIDLINAGFPKKIWDKMHPTVEFTTWFHVKPPSCGARFEFEMKLGTFKDVDDWDSKRLIKGIYYYKTVKNKSSSEWYKITRVAKGYPAGTRKLSYLQSITGENYSESNECYVTGTSIRVLAQ